MATNCDKCGHRDNESAGGIEELGQRMKQIINTQEDLSRDVLKSELAMLSIPELDFEMEMGTLGGKFTTIEGLLMDVKNQILSCKRQGTRFVLDDPSGNSFIPNRR
ncbi:zinc finger protein ZPR1 [Biomphalaria glabrata]|nr:zinc finger protein ZPR1-like [Biomphalaria glabrata]